MISSLAIRKFLRWQPSSFAHEELAPLELLEVLAEGLAGHGDAVQMQHVAQLQHHGRHATGIPEVFDRVAPGCLHVREHRNLSMDAIEVVDGDLHTGLASDHRQVQQGVQ